MKNNGEKVCLDDRDFSIGEKIKDNELFGIRNIIIIGNNFEKDGLVDTEDRLLNTKNTTKMTISLLDFSARYDIL